MISYGVTVSKCYPQFNDEEIEAQRREVSCPKSVNGKARIPNLA